MKVDSNQSYKIQMLRGIAIVAVVIIHNIPIGIAQVWARPFVNFAVPLFLFLSGLLSKKETKVLGRIKKVVIPYCIWTLVYTVLLGFHSPKQLLIQYPKRLLAADSAVIMYYIFVYCALTLLIPLIDKMARSRWRMLGLLVSPVEILIVRLIPFFCGVEYNKHFLGILRISCLGWFSFFYFGYLLGNRIIEIKIRKKLLLILLVPSLGAQIAEGYLYYRLNHYDCGTTSKIFAFTTSMILMIIFYQFIISEEYPRNRVLKLLGDCSFGIYFSHLAFMSVLKYHFPYYDLVDFIPINVIVVLLVSTCFVLVGRKVLGKCSRYLAL